VQSERNRRKHTSTCKFRDKDDPTLFTETLYLYREFTTEAIRMLLPATSLVHPGRVLHTFVAALLLGLREKFAGNIDHLQTTVMQEPIPGSGISKHYLVLYDVVPGGTGYLKELMQSTDVLREVFTFALQRARSCECHDDDARDGCYRCLYAYRLSNAMADISSVLAEEVLTSLLRAWDGLHAVKSIDEITIIPLIESELERLFLTTLAAARPADHAMQMKKEFFGFESGYRLRMAGREFALILQKYLGGADGVTIPSRADFVIYPLDTDSGAKPVAVFTDGFEYHAAQWHGAGRVGYDLNQRMAILRSGGFRVWSLTWDDLLAYEKATQTSDNPFTAVRPATLHTLLDQPSVPARVRALEGMHATNPFAQLLAYLITGDDAAWEQYATRHGLSGIENRGTVSESEANGRRQLLWSASGAEFIAPFSSTDSGKVLYDERIISAGGAGSDEASVGIISRMLPLLSAADISRYRDLRVLLRFFDGAKQAANDQYRERWNAMLSALNLYQFIPGFAIVADSGVTDAAEEWLVGESLEVGAVPGIEDVQTESRSNEWPLPLEDLLSPDAITAVHALQAMGLRGGDLMYELLIGGRVAAQSLMAWDADRVVLLVENDLSATAWESAGWLVVTPATCQARASQIQMKITIPGITEESPHA
jgi:DEAD/DEAH box helicase domain-containing protein